jgi:hypothetical protein
LAYWWVAEQLLGKKLGGGQTVVSVTFYPDQIPHIFEFFPGGF